MADHKVELNGGPRKSSRLIQFSFADQFSAVWTKTATNQLRQYKTNLCQIIFPVVLLVVLFGMQQLVNTIVQDRSGKYIAATPRPALTPSLLFVSANPINCGDDPSGLILDTKNGNIYFAATPDNNDAIGTFAGLPNATNAIDQQTQAQILGKNFTQPNPGPASGIWGNVNTPITNFFALKGRISVQGGSVVVPSYCPTPRFVYPIVKKVPDLDGDGSETSADIGQLIYERWRSENVLGGYDLTGMNLDTNSIHVNLYYNLTISTGLDVSFLVNFFTNALWRTIVSNETAAYLTAAGTKNMPQPQKLNEIDLISLLGPTLFIYIFHLMMPVMLQNLVFEKEFKLREIMKMMGLKTYIYWIVTYLFNYILYALAAALCVALACAMNFRFFRVNSFVSYFLLLFLWGHVMIATAFFFSVFLTKSRTATVVGYTYVLGIGMFGPNVIQTYFDNPDTPSEILLGISVFPPFAFYRGLSALSRGVSYGGTGISMSELAVREYGLSEVYICLIVEAVVLMLLAVYFEAVLPIGPGVKSHPCFCLPKRKRCGGEDHDEYEDDGPTVLPDDVLAEKSRVIAEAGKGKNIITVHDLRKVYPSHSGVPPKVAVNTLTMGIAHGECFGFLGPNGAGKSTTINMLCGYLRPSSGNAFVDGFSIRDDIDLIHLQMGVCPQEDCLWDDLTGAEHLRFYGRLKNLRGKELDEQVEYWLKAVNLADPKTKVKYSRQYSGGMKRRLSVGISLIGNPKVVLLDEPTTGLDPASRISLYEVIRACKKDVAMMLTTHSMEEAEILCDRLGIFVSGNLRTIGAPADLKNRYGQFYRVLLTTEVETETKARKFLETIAPGVRMINSLAGTATYEVPRKNIKLSELFSALSLNKQRLNIKDWGVSNTTLEEVFLKITLKETEDEAAVLARKLAKAKQQGCCGRKKPEDAQELKQV